MPEFNLKTATLAQLKQYADENGLDYSDFESQDPRKARFSLIARIRLSNLLPGDSFELLDDPEANARQSSKNAWENQRGTAEKKTRANLDAEEMSDETFALLAQALWPETKTGRYVIPPGMTKEMAVKACREHQLRGRNHPKNPLPGKYVGDLVEMMIPSQNPKLEPGGDQPVWVCVNGRSMLLPRSEWFKIPYEFALSLANARTKLYESDERTGLKDVGEGYQYSFQTR